MRRQPEESGKRHEEVKRRARSLSHNREENTEKLKHTARSVVYLTLALNRKLQVHECEVEPGPIVYYLHVVLHAEMF